MAKDSLCCCKYFKITLLKGLWVGPRLGAEHLGEGTKAVTPPWRQARWAPWIITGPKAQLLYLFWKGQRAPPAGPSLKPAKRGQRPSSGRPII